MTDQCPDEWESEDLYHDEDYEHQVFENNKKDTQEIHWRPVAKTSQQIMLEILKRNKGR